MGEDVVVVVVGDSEVGKSCLCSIFGGNSFPEEHVPTVMDIFHSHVVLNNQKVRVEVQDTAGNEDFDRIRLLQYPRAKVVVVCFSIDCKSSMENVKRKWMPEVRHNAPNVPFVLVGNKSDLRQSCPDCTLMTEAQCQKFSQEIKAELYMEASALKNWNVYQVFLEAVRVSRQPKKKKENKGKVCDIV